MEELQSTNFKTVFRGYDKESVHHYIRDINEQFASAKEAAESIIRNQNQTIEDLTAKNKELEERVRSIEAKKAALYAVAEQTLSAAKAKAAELASTSEQTAAELTQKTKEETDALRLAAKEETDALRRTTQEETDALKASTKEETDALKAQTEEASARILTQAQEEADRLIADAQTVAQQSQAASLAFTKEKMDALSSAYRLLGSQFAQGIEDVVAKIREEIAQQQATLLSSLEQESNN